MDNQRPKTHQHSNETHGRTNTTPRYVMAPPFMVHTLTLPTALKDDFFPQRPRAADSNAGYASNRKHRRKEAPCAARDTELIESSSKDASAGKRGGNTERSLNHAPYTTLYHTSMYLIVCSDSQTLL